MKSSGNTHLPERTRQSHMAWFFCGGETVATRFNTFTGTFIKLMGIIMGRHFDYIREIYFNNPVINVIWSLNHSQRPVFDPHSDRIINTSAWQIITGLHTPDTQVILIGSSTGSTIAAQTACYLMRLNTGKQYFTRPIHLAIGTSIISTESDLFQSLVKHRIEGKLGRLLHDELQDVDDNTNGAGGNTRFEAYRNAAGILFPFLSSRYIGPSFLNKDPVNGHIHRIRSHTVQKAIDFVEIIIVRNKLAGQYYSDKALSALEDVRNGKLQL